MTIAGKLIMKVKQAAHNESAKAADCYYSEGRILRKAVDAIIEFFEDYETVTVRSLGGSLEIGRPVGSGQAFSIGKRGAEALPALMLRHTPDKLTPVASALYENAGLVEGARGQIPWDELPHKTKQLWLGQARIATKALAELEPDDD